MSSNKMSDTYNVCPKCRTQVERKDRICPSCGENLKKNNKNFFLALLGLFFILGVIGIGVYRYLNEKDVDTDYSGTSDVEQTEEDSNEANNEAEEDDIDDSNSNVTINITSDSEEATEKVTKTYLNQEVEYGDYLITVHEFYELTEADIKEIVFFEEVEGLRYYAVEIEMKNISESGNKQYSFADWKMLDDEGVVYDSTWPFGKKPSLDIGQLKSGESAIGWITYEVSEDQSPEILRFTPVFGQKDTLEIYLEESSTKTIMQIEKSSN
jgi:hypothetical protein